MPVTNALHILVKESTGLLVKHGGIDTSIPLLQANGKSYFKDSMFEDIPDARRLFVLMLRPYDWFEKHFRVALGFGIDSMTKSAFGHELTDEFGDYAVLRYEDLPNALTGYLATKKIVCPPELKRENNSETKGFSREIAEFFKSDAIGDLRKIAKDTKYARGFGYD